MGKNNSDKVILNLKEFSENFLESTSLEFSIMFKNGKKKKKKKKLILNFSNTYSSIHLEEAIEFKVLLNLIFYWGKFCNIRINISTNCLLICMKCQTQYQGS